MRAADVVLSISHDEVDQIHEAFGQTDVRVFPGFCYDEFIDPGYEASRRSGVLFVGGFRHPPNQDALTWMVQRILPKIHEKLPDVQFHIVGSELPSEFSLQLSRRGSLVFHGWMSETALEDLYHRVKIAVVPLRYGAGLKGKVVQAMRYGVPVVSTAIGLEGVPQEIKSLMQSYDTEDDFAARIERLLCDDQLADRLSSDLLAATSKYFSRSRSKDFFRDLCEKTRCAPRWIAGVRADGWTDGYAIAKVPGDTPVVLDFQVPETSFEEGHPLRVKIDMDGREVSSFETITSGIQQLVLSSKSIDHSAGFSILVMRIGLPAEARHDSKGPGVRLLRLKTQ